jgi:predicted metal-dependent enzyme (double-stranded beta helix superfamily)
MQSMIELTESEREILLIGGDLMSRLIAETDWLPDIFSIPNNTHPHLFQLYSDGLERFTIAATILAGGQTPSPHLDPIWEIVGVQTGTIKLERFQETGDGQISPKGDPALITQGQVLSFGSKNREVLRLANGTEDDIAVLIHVYGAEMTKFLRKTFLPDGSKHEASVVFHNGPDYPPYDIFSIQTRIED